MTYDNAGKLSIVCLRVGHWVWGCSGGSIAISLALVWRDASGCLLIGMGLGISHPRFSPMRHPIWWVVWRVGSGNPGNAQSELVPPSIVRPPPKGE